MEFSFFVNLGLSYGLSYADDQIMLILISEIAIRLSSALGAEIGPGKPHCNCANP